MKTHIKRKLRVAVLFGGRSAEHEVSVRSARNVVSALDPTKYTVVLIGILKNGSWIHVGFDEFVGDGKFALPRDAGGNDAVSMLPGSGGSLTSGTGKTVEIDVVFPVLHGPFGEDGTVQGLLKLAGVPFVGAGVLGSAVGMDKDVMKRLLRDAGIPTPKFLVFHDHEAVHVNEIVAELGLPFFIKPANLGSSVGISKVPRRSEFARAMKTAFLFDRKVIVEECIVGRELECSVLGNDAPIASVPGEIVVEGGHEFYSYEAKYLDEHGASLIIPAKLSPNNAQRVSQLAVKTFRALCCEGMARVDFFLRGKNELLVNEINTIPGFTSISMYPKLWEASGITYTELVDRLIELSVERFKRERSLKTAYVL